MAIRKTFAIGAIDEYSRTVPVLASTPDPVDGEALESWNLDRFLKNPIVLFSHDPEQIIGTASDVRMTPDGLAMTIQFAAKNDLAEEKWQLARQGVLKTVSVGFAPGEATVAGGITTRTANELLEVSFVAVPADENAGTAALTASDAAKALAAHKYAKKIDANEDVPHFDHGTLGNVQRTQVGGAKIKARLSRIGVLEYRNRDGSIRRELRLPEEVFKADSLATLHGAPVIDFADHTGMVTPETWRKVSLGHTESVHEDSKNFVSADLIIQDAETLERIDRGERTEISCGYVCRNDATPGVWNGQPYDVVQRDIRYNHVALCPPNRGRAGPSVGLRLDSKDAWCVSDHKEEEMKLIRLDGKDFEIGSEVHLAKIEEMHQAELAALKKQADEAQGRLDAKEEALTKAQKEAADSKRAAAEKEEEAEKKMAARIRSRLRLLRSAFRLFGKDEEADEAKDDDKKMDGMSDREVMLAAIQKDSPDFTGEGRSDDYVTARFDALVEQAEKNGGVDGVVSAAKDATDRLDAADGEDIVGKAREAHKKAMRDAWKAPAGGNGGAK